jgi:hypothetical protein
MTPAVAGAYSRHLRKKFRMWPTWLPTDVIQVGDFGRVEGGIFTRLGRLEEPAGVAMVRIGTASGDHLFASSGVRQLSLTATAASVSADAFGTRIKFGRKLGVFVALRKSREQSLADPLEIAARLALLRESGRWQDDYCIVTGVLCAESALIAVGGESGGSIELSALAPATDIFTCLDVGLQVHDEQSIAYRAVMRSSCTPLFRLARLGNSNELVLRGPAAASPRLLELDPTPG